ncbi:GDSL-type esterase/lipase family protein [Kribbella sp. NPDC002412]
MHAEREADHDVLARQPDVYGTSVEQRGEERLSRGLKQLAPNARILVTAYGTYIRPNGCYPQIPVWPVDANYLQATVDRLNAMLAEQSAAHGAQYVDLRTPSIGHDACAPITQRWLEGLVPTSVAAPLHPSARGMAAFGAIVAEAAS